MGRLGCPCASCVDSQLPLGTLTPGWKLTAGGPQLTVPGHLCGLGAQGVEDMGTWRQGL